MEMQIETMDKEGLMKLKADVEAQISLREKENRKAALEAAEAAAREHGYALRDLLPGTQAVKPGKKSKTPTNRPAMFRDPENPALTWSGRGRRPNWMKEAVEKGLTEEDLRIPS